MFRPSTNGSAERKNKSMLPRSARQDVDVRATAVECRSSDNSRPSTANPSVSFARAFSPLGLNIPCSVNGFSLHTFAASTLKGKFEGEKTCLSVKGKY